MKIANPATTSIRSTGSPMIPTESAPTAPARSAAILEPALEFANDLARAHEFRNAMRDASRGDARKGDEPDLSDLALDPVDVLIDEKERLRVQRFSHGYLQWLIASRASHRAIERDRPMSVDGAPRAIEKRPRPFIGPDDHRGASW